MKQTAPERFTEESKDELRRRYVRERLAGSKARLLKTMNVMLACERRQLALAKPPARSKLRISTSSEEVDEEEDVGSHNEVIVESPHGDAHALNDLGDKTSWALVSKSSEIWKDSIAFLVVVLTIALSALRALVPNRIA